MTTLKTYAAMALAFLGVLFIAPILALIGIMVIGLTFVLSLIAVGTLATATQRPAMETGADNMPQTEDRLQDTTLTA